MFLLQVGAASSENKIRFMGANPRFILARWQPEIRLTENQLMER